MNNQSSILSVEKYFYRLRSKENNIDNYYNKQMRNMSIGSKIMYLVSICKLFETNEQRNRKRGGKGLYSKPIENTDVNKLTKREINEFLKCEWFNKLTNHTKNQHLIRIKKYLTFSNREDLVDEIGDLLFKKEKRTLSKNDLISRKDLKFILEHCNLKMRTLLMVLYEGALRIDEALNIKFKNIKFNGGYAILQVEKSKTKQRDLPLIESIPYLNEYFDKNSFKPNDRIFLYKRNTTVNTLLFFLKQRLEEQKPEWKSKKLYPHLFRHSRLTELAAGKLNEAQIRRFAGWTPKSTMAEIYFHLDDQDVINILTKGEIKKPEPKKFEAKGCRICNAENNFQNTLCWKCNNVLDESKSTEAGLYLINQTGKVDTLKTEFSEIKEKILNMEKTIKLQEQYIFHLITKDTEYKDLKLDENTNLTDRLIQEYNKILEK